MRSPRNSTAVTTSDEEVFLPPRHRVTRYDEADIEGLVERIQRGEVGLIGFVYEHYFDALYGFLCSLLNDRAEVEDIVQQVFERMLEALSAGEIRKARSFRSWLFSVARTRALDHRRKHERADVIAPEEFPRGPGERRAVSHELEPSSLWIFDPELARALRSLPTLAREVVLLRYVGDFDLAEIAGIVGVSEDSAKQAHRRALRALRSRLGGGEHGGAPRRLAMRQLVGGSRHGFGHSFSPAS